MRILTPFAAIVAILGCSPNTAAEEKQADEAAGSSAPSEGSDLRSFAGQPFSSLVRAHPDFRLAKRAISREALGAFAESDGIESPGEIHPFNGRELLVFSTCRRDVCSSASNLIVIDLSNSALHVVHQEDGQQTIVVDGPPDIRAFISASCPANICNWEAAQPPAAPDA